MIDIVIAKVRARAGALRDRAAERRAVTATDPAADALHWCALDLEALATEIEAASETLTTDAYARLHGTTPQSVCRWIAKGELEAERGPDGHWKIAASAERRTAAARGHLRMVVSR